MTETTLISETRDGWVQIYYALSYIKRKLTSGNSPKKVLKGLETLIEEIGILPCNLPYLNFW